MNQKEFSVRSLVIADADGSISDPNLRSALAQILLAEAVNDLTLVLEALLGEVDSEKLIQLRRDKGGLDVELLDDPAQAKFQFEAHDAHSVDPTVLNEDSSMTLTEFPPINQSLGLKPVIQARNEDLEELGRR